MEEFLEFTTTPDDLSVASPKRGYSLSVVRESVWRVDVGNASVRQTSEEAACDVLEVSGYTSASRTVQMYLDTATGRGNKLYKVAFSVVGVSALTVTFSTGLDNRESATVPVPTSSSLQVPGKYSLFDLYVDALGNVSAGGLGAGIIEQGLNDHAVEYEVFGHSSRKRYPLDVMTPGDYVFDTRGISPKYTVQNSWLKAAEWKTLIPGTYRITYSGSASQSNTSSTKSYYCNIRVNEVAVGTQRGPFTVPKGSPGTVSFGPFTEDITVEEAGDTIEFWHYGTSSGVYATVTFLMKTDRYGWSS